MDQPAVRGDAAGIGGSIFPNAAWRLSWALGTLEDRDERIRIPGFYDPVRAPSACDRELLAALPEVADEYRSRYGVKGFLRGLTGGPELRTAEVFEPTCTICGLTAGYQGRGSKTVLPARASAKVDFRLVPDQTPEQVGGSATATPGCRGLRRHRRCSARRGVTGSDRSRSSVPEAGGRHRRAGLRNADAGGHCRSASPRRAAWRWGRRHPRACRIIDIM
ncbi:MAG TPA: peptidase dimerization domain-containing protein [Candidatus Eisenbacteria bacterium]